MSKLEFQLRHQEAVVVTEGTRSVLQKEWKKIWIQDSQETLRQRHKKKGIRFGEGKRFLKRVCVWVFCVCKRTVVMLWMKIEILINILHWTLLTSRLRPCFITWDKSWTIYYSRFSPKVIEHTFSSSERKNKLPWWIKFKNKIMFCLHP